MHHLETLGDDSHVRLTYDGEYLEIRSPGKPHDFIASLLGDMISAIRDEWPIVFTSYRSATFKADRITRGFEGDLSYYIGDINNRIQDVWNPLDASTDPPPDLVVEVDITHKSTDKFPLFTQFGIPEVWQYTTTSLLWYAYEGGTYVPIATSRMIPGLPLFEAAKRLATAQPGSAKTFIAEWRQWLQAHVYLHEAAKATG